MIDVPHALAFAIALGLPAVADGESPSEPPMRVIAEWEQVETVVVRWPPVHNPIVYPALDDAASLTVLLPDASDQADADAYFANLGIDATGVTYIVTTSAVSPWPRDWGPYAAFDGQGTLTLVDPLFDGYPGMGQSCEPPFQYVYVPPQIAGDKAANADIAQGLGIAYASMPAYATGGNLLVDGFGGGFSSCLMLAENESFGISESVVRDTFATSLGITDLTVLENWETSGIQHIDCWAKWVDEETVLIKRPPAGHPESGPTEVNVQVLEGMLTPWGRPYRIIRVDTPPYNTDGQLANYLNSYIVNTTVLVPTFGLPAADDAALQAYRDALPGYDVIGVPAIGFYNYTDAIHCRTRSIYDGQMVRVEHARVRGVVDLGMPTQLAASITAYAQADVDGTGSVLRYREVGTSAWVDVPFTLSEAQRIGPTRVDASAAIPAFTSPTRVEYVLVARDIEGNSGVLPPAGERGPVRFLTTDGGLAVEPVSFPQRVDPGDRAVVVARVTDGSDQLAADPMLEFTAIDGGQPYAIQMEPTGTPGEFSAVLPGFVCGHEPSFVVVAQAASAGERRWPASTSARIVVSSEIEDRLIDAGFESAALPAGWAADGLWRSGASCAAAGGCAAGSAHAAFADTSCTYDTGARVNGLLEHAAVDVPADGAVMLRLCHNLLTENSDFGFQGYDVASLLVNGEPVLSPIADTDGWATLELDLSHFAGQQIDIALSFDSVDEQYNDYPGWRVSSVELVSTAVGCDTSCPTDFDASGATGLPDLLVVLASFGVSPAGDADLDGGTDLVDLLQTLASFGAPCPL